MTTARIITGIHKTASATGIDQDNIIFGMVLLAFVVYVTVKGELPTYLGFFTPKSQLGPAVDTVTAPAASGTAGQSGIAGTVNSAVNSTGIGSAISGLTGTAPLTLGGPVGSAINNGLGSIFNTIKGLF